MERDASILPRVDDGKRDFLKKLALAAAYATPAVATFSLDGLRKTATAQGVYVGAASVLGVVFIPGSDGDGFIVSRRTESDPAPFGTLRITYSKPMETSLNSCKKATGYGCDCLIIASKIEVLGADTCLEYPAVDLGDGWTWPDSTAEEKQVFTPVRAVSLELNSPGQGCAPGALYRALDGGLLDPFSDNIDTSEHCPPPILFSRIEVL